MKLLKIYDNKKVTQLDHDIAVTEQRFVFDKPINLVLKENIMSFSGDDFTIKDTEGVSYFKCKGKAMNIRDKKTIYDLYGTPILNIRNTILFLKDRMKVYADKDDKKTLATVTPVTSINSRKYTISFYNIATEKEETLDMKCDFFSHSCGIFYGKEKEGSPMICKIVKKIDAVSFLTNKDNYYVEVAPGIDAALMVAIAICFDELKNDDSRKKKY
ncbi:tubby C-terminal-like domain-containing protein [Neocallimastix lanati (nom. inval.)]|jgi:uncharacterized protein YxjI|uniref:DUF567-domain-containing protein n=1 Tax=Neocallimastix californiae TaxID=1754190 RepID=A0A1Y2B449_9FUNG|nr:tubby C-terminal-like domain-containing protein [Neocallimastix sp. JGI-2020a]ORY29601.1 hypothetical protein LY90DRAFT_424718 [Neocallimastix californiae]|eukprot:ORY29601.1 hypothetical protein LY90DRAFT_424718 [Neocallimastix californiae]